MEATDIEADTPEPVAAMMLDAQRFVCSFDCEFMLTRFEQIEGDVCTDMYKGFTKMSLAMWLLSFFTLLALIMSTIMGVTLRGKSRMDVEFENSIELKGIGG